MYCWRFFHVGSAVKSGRLFMTPLWGGPEYSYSDTFSLKSICDNHRGGGFAIFDLVKKIHAQNRVPYAPRPLIFPK